MESALKYVIDDNGHRSSVLVPIKDWDEINKKYTALLNKVSIMTGIQKGLQEVKQAKKTGKKLQTLKDFLHERNC